MNHTSEAIVSERQRKYEEVCEKANKAQVAATSHHCERYNHAMTEWFQGELQVRFEVRIPCTDADCSDEWEYVFGGESRGECDTYIRTSDLQRAEIVENGVCKVCDAYEKRKAAVAQGKQPSFLLVATATSRHYGGPEEGGWWYNRTHVVEVRKAHTFEQGLRWMRALKEEYPQPKYSIYSCANRGEPEYQVRCVYSEDDPRFPEESPPGRPRYE